MKKKTVKINKAHLLKWIEKFRGVSILVVGDLMLDCVVRGSVERISPEAPVPVVNVKEETATAGGAGNVVYNLAALGAVPTLVSVRGGDAAGDAIVKDFRTRSITVDGLLIDSRVPTITKTRVCAGQQQIVRFDQEQKDSFSSRTRSFLLKSIKNRIPANRGVIISDYGKGVISAPVIQTILKEAHKRKMYVTVDPKVEHFMQYKGLDCITPNTKEAVEGMRTLKPKTEEGFIDLGRQIVKRLKCQSLLMTRGEKGISLFLKKGEYHSVPAHAKEVFDVTGAGDTVVASATFLFDSESSLAAAMAGIMLDMGMGLDMGGMDMGDDPSSAMDMSESEPGSLDMAAELLPVPSDVGLS